MRKMCFAFLPIVLIISIIISLFWLKEPSRISLVSPFPTDQSDSTSASDQPLPLEKYSIPNLKLYPYQPSQITVTEELQGADDFTTYIFQYQTMDKKMTGTINIPAPDNLNTASPLPVILMVRGYATPAQFYPGFGTRNAASVFAQNGYITIAPDFFNFGGSDPETEDSWEARFVKPINVIELVKTIQENPRLVFNEKNDLSSNSEIHSSNLSQLNQLNLSLDPDRIGIWGHSNGGQITITVLQITGQPIPATVWAPVTAPFPYSILFFSRTSPDEGKETRAWLAMFERDYDVFEFTITQHLDKLSGPLQIHHGSADPDALQVWSDEFVKNIEQENKRRQELLKADQEIVKQIEDEANVLENKATSNPASTLTLETLNFDKIINQDQLLNPIEYSYYKYPEADHNLQPPENWNQAIQRDLEFFANYL